jgi:hypothetical protein
VFIQFIKELQKIAEEKRVRITILGCAVLHLMRMQKLTIYSGDVHLTGIGQFMSNPRLDLPKVNDHRFMPNIISSAIVNTPPPNSMSLMLRKISHTLTVSSDGRHPE